MMMLGVARKTLREIWREPQLLALTLLLPVIFVVITAVSYGGDLLATYPVAVIAGDDAAVDGLIAALTAETYADGRAVFAVQRDLTRDAADAALAARTITLLIVIEPGADGLPAVTFKADALYTPALRASALAEGISAAYANDLRGLTAPIQVRERPLFTVGPRTEFDVYAPGMIIFALMLIVPQMALLVARNRGPQAWARPRGTYASAHPFHAVLDREDVLHGAAMQRCATGAPVARTS